MEREEPTEYAFGDYAPGRWAFQLEDPERLATPVPWQGSQGDASTMLHLGTPSKAADEFEHDDLNDGIEVPF